MSEASLANIGAKRQFFATLHKILNVACITKEFIPHNYCDFLQLLSNIHHQFIIRVQCILAFQTITDIAWGHLDKISPKNLEYLLG